VSVKGTELSEKQLKAAERFILSLRAKGNTQTPESTQIVTQRWDSLVRLVAFYGAIRAKAMLHGGTVEEPGETFKQATP
jgi:hypothetical protein